MWFRILSRPFSTSSGSELALHPFTIMLSSQQSVRIPHALRRLQINGSRRLKSTKSTTTPVPPGQAKQKLKYPERLLIYHAGTGKIVFIGSMKVTCIVIFVFFGFVAAPAHYYSPDEPNWIAPAVLTCGILPLLFVTYITSPTVAFIHLRLPTYARTSTPLLHRFTATLPPTSEIDITTMNLIGRQRISRIPISRLYPQQSRFGIANYARVLDGKVEAKRKWWVPRPPTVFGVGRKEGSGVVREMGVWGDVVKVIERGRGKENGKVKGKV